MAFEEVNGLDCDTTVALGGVNKKTGKPNPTTVEGYFVGTKQVSSPKSKTGKASLHILQTQKGNIGVWGKTDLDRKLSVVSPGQMIRVTQDGKVPTPNGDMYKYKVLVDKDNTIDVGSAAPESGLNAADSADNDSYTDADDSFDRDEELADEVPYKSPVPAARAAVPSASNQARVQALLKGRGKAS